MRKILAALLFGVMAAGTASAADLPAKAPRMVAPAAFSWTGFYIGANVGYGWARNDSTLVGVAAAPVDIKMDGVIGGGQIGYNWQTGSLVLGIEVDGQGSGQKATFTAPGASETDKIPWFATLRGRVGWAFADRWMVYATGGGGWIDFKSTITVTPFGTANWEKSHAAWTVGAGIEQAFAQNWSWKVEYLYIDTGSFSTNLFNAVPINMRVKDNIVRLGVNYHF